MASTPAPASSTPSVPATTPTSERPNKRSRPSSTRIKIPKISPFKIYSAEEDEQAKALDDKFVDTFQMKCIMRPPVLGNFVNAFPVDIWKDILDYVHSPTDLLSLCRTSSCFYLLVIPRLYSTLTIRSPFYYGETDINPLCRTIDPHNLITIDTLLKPIFKDPGGDSTAPRKRARLLQGYSTKVEDQMFVGGCGARSSSTTKLPPKGDLLHYIKDLRVEKWEGADATKVMTQTNVKSASDCRGERQFVVQSEYRPEGVIDLNWTRDGEVVSLSTKLAELLGDMKSLEKFCYNPQRYISIPDGPPPGEPEPIFHVNGITAEIFTVLKSLPHLRNLLINFSLWDPLDRTTEGFAVLARTSGYKGAITGLTGFKDLEELVIFGVCADRRFSEIGKVVGKCMFSIPFKRRLKWLEVRVDEPWYDDLQDSGHINSTQDLWDWAVSLWGKLFGAAESLRCSGGLDGVDIDFLLEFGPIRWQWKCPKLAGLICRPENLTVLNLRGVDEKQILGTIKRLAIMGTPSLEIFAVECRLTELNNVLKRFCGLRELYVFEPDAKERYEARNELRPNYKPLVGSRGVSYEKPVDIKGIQWALDTISKFHLITLKVLVIEEIICPPRINCASTTINNIGGWRERGGNLRELGVHLWGPWEEIGEFLTAFGGLKSFHLFNCQRPEGLFHDEYGHFIKAARTAVMIANLWGREVICARKKVKPTMLEENRWIGVGPHFLDMVETWRWKWRIDDALKYVNGEGVLMYAGKAVKRPWEEGGRMWVVLRKGGVLTREDW